MGGGEGGCLDGQSVIVTRLTDDSGAPHGVLTGASCCAGWRGFIIGGGGEQQWRARFSHHRLVV